MRSSASVEVARRQYIEAGRERFLDAEMDRAEAGQAAIARDILERPARTGCNYKGILLDACTRFRGDVCVRCGKRKARS